MWIGRIALDSLLEGVVASQCGQHMIYSRDGVRRRNGLARNFYGDSKYNSELRIVFGCSHMADFFQMKHYGKRVYRHQRVVRVVMDL